MSSRNRKSLRKRLIARLSEVGLVVGEPDLWCQEGGHRHMDVARWGAVRVQMRPPLILAGRRNVALHSWDTMTDCANRGIQFGEAFPDSLLEIEVHALPIVNRYVKGRPSLAVEAP